MKKECDIVQDLLFGYKDNILKQGSRELVSEHLKKCENCKDIWEQLNKENSVDNKEKIEIDYLKNVKKKINKKNKIIIFSAILLLLIICLNIGSFVRYIKDAENMDIYFNDEISKEQLDEITQEILNVDKDAKIIYKTKQDALDEMKEKFKENSNLLNGYNESNNPLKPYIIVDSNIKDVREIEKKLKSKSENIIKIKTIIEINPYEYMIGELMSNL